MSEWQHEDLLAERQFSDDQLLQLVNIVDGGAEHTVNKRLVWDQVLNHAEFASVKSTDYMSHEERYNYNLSRGLALLRFINDQGLDINQMRRLLTQSVSSFVTPDGNPLIVHQVMFIYTLVSMCSDEQQEKWLHDAQTCRIIGTYAQTELAHGTFVRGLRTTATYRPESETFELHSGDTSAAKWWPGGLGNSATHALVMARLVTADGAEHGIHPFIVQLRDLSTHRPLPGITVGDIGPKLGLNSLNNGYLMFDRVSIPRDHMLMKNAHLSADGVYSRPIHDKLSYGTMVFTRVTVVRDVLESLRMACVIAARYSVVRRQGQPDSNGREVQIIDYQCQRLKVLPHVAACYVLVASADTLWLSHQHVSNSVRQGCTDQLSQIHADSSALKAYVTGYSCDAVTTLRAACGGHGYMSASRMPQICAHVVASAAWEGDNTVLSLQVARYIIKNQNESFAFGVTSLLLKHLTTNATEAPSGVSISEQCIQQWSLLSELYRYLTACVDVRDARVTNVAHKLEQLTQNVGAESAWNSSQVLLSEMTKAHCHCYVLHSYLLWLEKWSNSASDSTFMLLCRLGLLYATFIVYNNCADFVTYGSWTADHLRENHSRMLQLLDQIRPSLILLVDAFDFPDAMLNSTLGAYDGDVYNRMFKEAQKSPLNDGHIPEAILALKLCEERSKL